MWIQIPPALSKSGFFSSLVSTLQFHFFPSFFFFLRFLMINFVLLNPRPRGRQEVRGV